jgi:hypothetical protein
MVLVKSLTRKEMDRHYNLIKTYFKEVRHTDDVSIDFYDNGSEKGIYKVKSGTEAFVAAATARNQNNRLLTEYNILHQLFNSASEYFPRPIAHYAPEQIEELGDLFLMELLPFPNLMKFDRSKYHNLIDFQRDLAYEIGKGIAIVNGKTGRYSSDPHDGNILARIDENDGLELKFVDAIQFRVGGIEEAGRSLLTNRNDRPECFRFIHKLREGMADGMNTTQGIEVQEAWDKLDFMREYNDIF